MELIEIVTIGSYDPPLVWEAATVVKVNPTQWERMIANVIETNHMEEFKKWLDGKLIRIVKRGDE